MLNNCMDYIGLFERHSEEFVRLIVDAFAYGHSTRKIAQFLKTQVD